jgi:phosphonate transport system substrate-binding protein
MPIPANSSCAAHTAHTAVGLALLALAIAVPAARAEEAYSFGAVPQFEQRKHFGIWKPLLDELEARTGLKLKLVSTAGVSEFARRQALGDFDFVYTNPYLVLSSGQGYVPLVRDAVPLRGILVVARDSPIHEIAELDGKLLAVPSPHALGASLLLRAELQRLHHVTMRLLDVKSHSSVYLHVAHGLVDAGGGVEKTLREQTPAVQESLRTLYTTAKTPSHPVAAHPRVPKADQEKMRQALLDLAATTGGKALLSAIPMTQPTAASVGDYQVMAGWQLERMLPDDPP